MNILLVDFGSFIQPDIISTLERLGIHYKNIYYRFPLGDEGKFHNEEFEKLMNAELKASSYDAVFSTNLLPVAGKVAYDNDLPYSAWSYDSPINLISREYFDLPNTNVFLFDRTEAEKYRKLGLDNFHHLPLAVNCERLSGIQPETRFRTEISFLGKLYNSTYPYLRAGMSEHEQGYCDALVKAQMISYGAYLIDEAIDDSLLEKINASYDSGNSPLKNINLSRAQLSFSLASHVTHIERVCLLNILSKNHEVRLFTAENPSEINGISDKVSIHGPLSYLEEMPALFKSCRINLCPILKNTQSGIPLRALDIIASSSFLLSSWQTELAEHFQNGREVIMYESIEDAIAKAEYYLAHDSEREAIIEAGYRIVSEDFRYEDRIAEIIRHMHSVSL